MASNIITGGVVAVILAGGLMAYGYFNMVSSIASIPGVREGTVHPMKQQPERKGATNLRPG